ncbi:Putative cell survival pathways protein [Saitoella coloradoensis]
MRQWLQGSVAYVTGTAEPEYGAEALHSVADQVAEGPQFSELTLEDLKWQLPGGSNVETQTFYIMADSGHLCFAQIIHSNIGFGQEQTQFTCRVYNKEENMNVWSSTNLQNFAVSEDGHSMSATQANIVLSEDGNKYTLRISANPTTIVDVEFTRTAPGLKAGKNGTTTYGTDANKPWGSMRHIFWPRASVTGTIIADGKALDIKGRGLFVHALQGMKPHHAAARWNFANFQGENYSAVMMEFTTPPSYGSVTVNVGGVAKDGQLVLGTVKNTATHVEKKLDEETGWEEPMRIEFTWLEDGKSKASIDAKLETRIERVDVLAEIPALLKKLVQGVAGTKPFIYQCVNPATLKLTDGDKEIEDHGVLFTEATFIS